MGEAKQVIARNKKAFHDYFVLDTYEAGLELFGTEIKSIRQGKVNLKDSWCSIDEGQMYAVGVHISPYDHGNIFNRDPMRRKRLLLHKKEILRLAADSQQQGLSVMSQEWTAIVQFRLREPGQAPLPADGAALPTGYLPPEGQIFPGAANIHNPAPLPELSKLALQYWLKPPQDVTTDPPAAEDILTLNLEM